MGLFVCDNCKCIENTALSVMYWSRNVGSLWLDEDKGKALCSECAPTKFKNGTRAGSGRWHGKFPKQHVVDYRKDNPDVGLLNY